MTLNNKEKRRKNVISIQDMQEARISDFIRLFQYIEEVSKLIGRKRALHILESPIIRKRLNWLKKNRETRA